MLKTNKTILFRFCFLAIFLIGGTTVFSQTTFDWRDSAADGNWTGSGDRWWNGSGNVSSPGSGILRFNNNHQLSMTNNVGGTLNTHRIIFGSFNTLNRSIGGSTVRLFDFDGADPKIENMSTGEHTISLNLEGDGDGADPLELNPVNGNLILSGTINNQGSSILIYGDNAKTIQFNNTISGGGKFELKQNSIAIFNATQSYTGRTEIDKGELWLLASGDVIANNNIFVGNSTQMGNVAKLFLASPFGGSTFSRNININNGNADTRFIGGLNSSGVNNFSGNIQRSGSQPLSIEVVNSGGTIEISGVINGSGSITTLGAGTVLLSGSNSYTGSTSVTAGTLRLGGAERISNSSNVVLSGGTFSTGENTGFSETVGTLNLSANSTIALGTGNHSLTFAASNGVTWNGTTLTVTGWTGTAGASGTAGKIFVGNSASGLTSGQLAKINFNGGYANGAEILETGEVVPLGASAPVILTTGALSALTTTYGTPSSETSFNVSGTNMQEGINVTPPTGFEVSSTSGSGFGSSVVIGASGTISPTPVYVRLAALTIPGTYSGNIVLTSAGAATVNVATESSTVTPKALTITGLTADTRTYDGTTVATFTGTPVLNGVVNSDDVSISGSGTASFLTKTVGTSKEVNITGFSLTGANASNYSLTQPTSSADITKAPLTITDPAVTSRQENGTFDATITGTLSGTISPDEVTLVGTGTFAQSTPGVGIPVTSTSTLSGADAGNYEINPQPTGLTGTITAAGPTASVISNGTGNSTICAGGTANIKVTITGGTSPYTVVYSDGTNNFTVNNYVSGANITVSPLSTTTYTLVSVVDANNATGTGNSGSATVTTTSTVVPTSVGTYTATLNHTDGATLNYIDGSCRLLSRIEDEVGGNVLGSTTVNVVLTSTYPLTQTSNAQTFGGRKVTVTPNNSGPATLTLYFTQSDFTFYNGGNGTLDVPSSGSNSDPNIGNLRIAQVAGGNSLDNFQSITPSSVNWNGIENRWEIVLNNVTLGSAGSDFYFYGPEVCNLLVNGNSIISSNITSVSAQIDWSPVLGVTGYNVRWKPSNSNVWITGSTSTNSIVLTFLSSSTQYDVQVRTVCNGGFGLASTIGTFTTLTALPTCNTPSNVTATNVSSTGATISWSSVPNVVTYYLRWRVQNTSSWTAATVTGTSVNLSPWLQSSTTYQYEVRSQCSGTSNGNSNYSVMQTFTTLAPLPTCNTPSNVTATNVNSTGATISWSSVPNVATYYLRWRVQNTLSWTTSTLTGTSLNLSPWLQPSTTYEYQVRSQCSGTSNGNSNYSVMQTFTTLAPLPTCDTPTSITATNINSTGATISWSPVPNVVTYYLRWRVQNTLSWTTSTLTGTSLNLSPWLQPSTTYEYQVRSQCSGTSNPMSLYTNIQTFTTGASFNSNEKEYVSLTNKNGGESDIDNILFSSKVTSKNRDIQRGGDFADRSFVHIFPNPTNDVLFLTFESKQIIETRIRIMDISGRIVKEINHTTIEGNNIIQISLGDLVQGVYMLQVSSVDGWLYTGRVVKTE